MACDFKKSRSLASFLSENGPGDSFMINNATFFVYFLPGASLFYLLLRLSFRLTRKWPISRIFRRFAFSGLFLQLLMEGNV